MSRSRHHIPTVYKYMNIINEGETFASIFRHIHMRKYILMEQFKFWNKIVGSARHYENVFTHVSLSLYVILSHMPQISQRKYNARILTTYGKTLHV